MVLNISDDIIILDGEVYERKRADNEVKVGRKFVAECLGCTVNNTYTRPWLLPDFGEALRYDKKPYTKEDVRAWLQIPLPKRKQMYKEYKQHEGNEQNKPSSATC